VELVDSGAELVGAAGAACAFPVGAAVLSSASGMSFKTDCAMTSSPAPAASTASGSLGTGVREGGAGSVSAFWRGCGTGPATTVEAKSSRAV
jgi:hypothetical protein